jgi:predicted DsbA family dithiol-disulfide isomerase
MAYTSTITFTLDTICPWSLPLSFPSTPFFLSHHPFLTKRRTYLAFLRLKKALSTYNASHPESPASFTLKLAPYQLYPEMSSEGLDKYAWYRDERYNGSEERMGMYMEVMGNLGKREGAEFDFRGTLGNTLDAHRVLHVLGSEEGQEEKAIKALESLYKSYFEERKHPSSTETLITACRAAGMAEDEAKELVQDRERASRETKAAIQEQVGNGVDSVPYVVFEGRKR